MKKLTISILIILMLMTLFSNLLAQDALFLLISPDARSSGMGEANVAIADDANAVFWNPAGLAFQSGMEFTASYAQWLPELTNDIWYGFAAFKYSLGNLGTIGFNVVYFHLGEQMRMSPTGQEEGKFSRNEFAITASYGATVTENFALGFGIKFIHLPSYNIFYSDEQVNKLAADLGILYKIPWLNNLSFGANLSNMGPKTNISKVNENPSPTHLKFGFAYRPINFHYNKIILAFDFNKLLVKQSDDGNFDSWNKALFSSWDNGFDDVTYSYGIEYLYGTMFALRVGYLYDYDSKIYYNNWGFGFKYSYFDFDISVIDADEGHPLNKTIRFSLKTKSLNSPSSLSSTKFSKYKSDFKKAISPNLSFWCPWIEDKNKIYFPTISFGANFLYRNTQNLLWEFGVLYSPLSVSEDYVTDFISGFSITQCSSSLTKIAAGARFLFPANLMNTGYLSIAVATYNFSDISVKYSGVKYEYGQTFKVKGKMRIEPEDKTVFGLQFGPGTMIQKSKNIVIDLRVNFHFLFGQSNTSYWFEPNFSFNYLF